MQIAQIRYFVTAAQLQNLSKAAEALHLSQPSLSRRKACKTCLPFSYSLCETSSLP